MLEPVSTEREGASCPGAPPEKELSPEQRLKQVFEGGVDPLIWERADQSQHAVNL